MSTITIDQVDYHYESSIQDLSQVTFVFLHGFLGSKRDFEKIVGDFSEQYLVLDLLGFGENKDQNIEPDRFIQKNQVEDLEDIFSKLNLVNINLVGYSMGGRLAIAYALKYPKRINSLFLESTTAGISDQQQRLDRQNHDKKLAHSVIDQGMDKFIENWEKLPLFSSQQAVSKNDFTFMHQQRIDQNPINVANSLLEMGTGKQPNYWPDVGQLSKLSVKIIVGSKDSKFIKIGHRLHELIHGSTLTVVSNSGHNVHFETPIEYKKILLNNLLK
ncbi:2-succinyl-6-hydroxy-2,4-cyclohexadiene-1-carboxylate synthase [Companilactobacillus sp.]|uniref:2-succinyl-6-hydroxy-2, 4-cyclohexadiene-1-carboxylate synthase n=1 Tax=Companilactobacillus sp. TaxID=2767905 RepID=UPI0026257150|nr:2-succinyl-6-hydroxy-2,4-cyclohexadiene-1-carboxylate synthase [Companilactobacillus sp.]